MGGSAYGKTRFSTKPQDTSYGNDDELKLHVLAKGEPCESLKGTNENDQKVLVPKVNTITTAVRRDDFNILKDNKQGANMSIAPRQFEFELYKQIIERKNPENEKYRDLSALIFSKELLALAYRKCSKAKGSITKGGDKKTISKMSDDRIAKISEALHVGK